MKFSATFVALSILAVSVSAAPQRARRATVAELAATQQGKKTVFEACSVDADCQQGCCGFSSGKCAGPAVAQTNGSGGCGHGGSTPNCDVAALLGFAGSCTAGATHSNGQDATVQAAASFAAQLDGITSFQPSASAPAAAAPPASNNAAAPAAAGGASIAQLAASQQGKKTVFEACSADSDCQQGCCGFSSGKCAGPAVAQTNGSGGCGHGGSTPNCDVAALLGFAGSCTAGATHSNGQDATVQAAASFAAQLDGITSFTPSVGAPAAAAPASNNAAAPAAAPASSGKSVAELAATQQGKKTVFETCAADSECQQGCCGFSSGKCAGPAVAQTNGSGGCGHGTSAPNCDVAALLGFVATCTQGATHSNGQDGTVQAAASFAAQLDGITSFKPSRK